MVDCNSRRVVRVPLPNFELPKDTHLLLVEDEWETINIEYPQTFERISEDAAATFKHLTNIEVPRKHKLFLQYISLSVMVSQWSRYSEALVEENKQLKGQLKDQIEREVIEVGQ